jgi:hypothetical protein
LFLAGGFDGVVVVVEVKIVGGARADDEALDNFTGDEHTKLRSLVMVGSYTARPESLVGRQVIDLGGILGVPKRAGRKSLARARSTLSKEPAGQGVTRWRNCHCICRDF